MLGRTWWMSRASCMASWPLRRPCGGGRRQRGRGALAQRRRLLAPLAPLDLCLDHPLTSSLDLLLPKRRRWLRSSSPARARSARHGSEVHTPRQRAPAAVATIGRGWRHRRSLHPSCGSLRPSGVTPQTTEPALPEGEEDAQCPCPPHQGRRARVIEAAGARI